MKWKKVKDMDTDIRSLQRNRWNEPNIFLISNKKGLFCCYYHNDGFFDAKNPLHPSVRVDGDDYCMILENPRSDKSNEDFLGEYFWI